eukprot:s670_g9.t1
MPHLIDDVSSDEDSPSGRPGHAGGLANGALAIAAAWGLAGCTDGTGALASSLAPSFQTMALFSRTFLCGAYLVDVVCQPMARYEACATSRGEEFGGFTPTTEVPEAIAKGLATFTMSHVLKRLGLPGSSADERTRMVEPLTGPSNSRASESNDSDDNDDDDDGMDGPGETESEKRKRYLRDEMCEFCGCSIAMDQKTLMMDREEFWESEFFSDPCNDRAPLDAARAMAETRGAVFHFNSFIPGRAFHLVGGGGEGLKHKKKRKSGCSESTRASTDEEEVERENKRLKWQLKKVGQDFELARRVLLSRDQMSNEVQQLKDKLAKVEAQLALATAVVEQHQQKMESITRESSLEVQQLKDKLAEIEAKQPQTPKAGPESSLSKMSTAPPSPEPEAKPEEFAEVAKGSKVGFLRPELWPIVLEFLGVDEVVSMQTRAVSRFFSSSKAWVAHLVKLMDLDSLPSKHADARRAHPAVEFIKRVRAIHNGAMEASLKFNSEGCAGYRYWFSGLSMWHALHPEMTLHFVKVVMQWYRSEVRELRRVGCLLCYEVVLSGSRELRLPIAEGLSAVLSTKDLEHNLYLSVAEILEKCQPIFKHLSKKWVVEFLEIATSWTDKEIRRRYLVQVKCVLDVVLNNAEIHFATRYWNALYNADLLRKIDTVAAEKQKLIDLLTESQESG